MRKLEAHDFHPVLMCCVKCGVSKKDAMVEDRSSCTGEPETAADVCHLASLSEHEDIWKHGGARMFP